MKAYIVITVEAGKARELARVVAGLPGVQMADACWGVGDIYAVVQFPNWNDLNELVLDKIHHTPGVTHTDTHVAIQS